jgi:hypothetical protein
MSTTNYLPLDSNAPSVFNTVLTSYHVCGEFGAYAQKRSDFDMPSRIHCAEQLDGKHFSQADLSPARSYCCTIMLSLWTGRYEIRLSICAVNYILYDQIEWIWTFVKGIQHFCLHLNPIIKAPMAAAKSYIHYKSLCSYFAHCVRHLHNVP